MLYIGLLSMSQSQKHSGSGYSIAHAGYLFCGSQFLKLTDFDDFPYGWVSSFSFMSVSPFLVRLLAFRDSVRRLSYSLIFSRQLSHRTCVGTAKLEHSWHRPVPLFSSLLLLWLRRFFSLAVGWSSVAISGDSDSGGWPSFFPRRRLARCFSAQDSQ